MARWFAIGPPRTEYHQDEPPEDYSPCLAGIEATTAKEARLIALRSSEFRHQVEDDRSDGVNPLGHIVIGAEPEHVCPFDDPPEDDEANAALQCPVCDGVWKTVSDRLARIEAKRRGPVPSGGP